jgi:hypothetical protein
MSGPISIKGDPIAVAWAMRWLAGEDDYVPLDYERRRPTTTEQCEAAWVRYRALTLANLNDDEQKDHDEEAAGTYR